MERPLKKEFSGEVSTSSIEQERKNLVIAHTIRNFKNHEVTIKVRALKLSAFVEDLVKIEFPHGYSHDGDGIDYELCLHQDFLFMLR